MYSTFSSQHPIGQIAGNSDALRESADHFTAWSRRLDDVGTAIKNIDPRSWEGVAAEAFRSVRDVQPKRWFDASDHFTQKASILRGHAEVIDWAKRERNEARIEWDEGYRLTESAAQATPRRQVSWTKHRTAELVFRLAPKSVFPGDEGAAKRAHALWRYNNAKAQLAASGDAAAKTLNDLAVTAPMHRTLLEEAANFTSLARWYNHYLFGRGEPLRTSVDNYTWPSVSLSNFGVDPTQYAGHDGEYSIGRIPSEIASQPFAMEPTDIPGQGTVGHVTFQLEGTLTVHGDSWEFTGNALPSSDYYDFDIRMDGSRSIPGEASTIAGAAWGKAAQLGSLGAANPTSYDVIIDGEIPIRETGRFK